MSDVPAASMATADVPHRDVRSSISSISSEKTRRRIQSLVRVNSARPINEASRAHQRQIENVQRFAGHVVSAHNIRENKHDVHMVQQLALQHGRSKHALRLMRACERHDRRIMLKHLIDMPRYSKWSMLVFYLLHITYCLSIINMYESSSLPVPKTNSSASSNKHMLVSMVMLDDPELTRDQRDCINREIFCTLVFTFEVAARVIIGSLDWWALLSSFTFWGTRPPRSKARLTQRRVGHLP
jgi:hypothetical protein